MDKPTWSQVVAGLADEMDYDKFKPAMAQYQGRAGDAYKDALFNER